MNHYVMDYGYVHCATSAENSSSPLQREQNVLYVHCATSEEFFYHYVMDHSYVRCAIAERQTSAMT